MKNIRVGQKEIIHFIGIGGIGMSGLSLIMKSKGFKIQGSDILNNKKRQNACQHCFFDEKYCCCWVSWKNNNNFFDSINFSGNKVGSYDH